MRAVLLLIATVILMFNFQSVFRGLSTNHAKLDPAAEDPSLRPPTSASAPADLADTIQAWTDSAPLWSVEKREASGGDVNMHLTRTTRVFRFVDDVHVRLIAAEGGGTRVEAESQSRVGKGDLGQNPRNLKELVGVITQR